MTEETKKRTRIAKIAITKKLEGTETQYIVSQGQSRQTQLAEGSFFSYQYNDQIFVHGGGCIELVDSHIVSTARPALLITILLEGKLSFGYDDLKFDFDANSSPQGVVVNLTKPANFHRSLIQNNHMNKINIAIKPAWLESRIEGSIDHQRFIETHNAFYQLKLNSAVIDLLHTLSRREPPVNVKERLEVESLIYQVVTYAIGQMPDEYCKKSEQKKHSVDARIENIISYIETHLEEELSLERLAEEFSMSVSNLQRRFKQSLDITVNGYIRHRRLEIARQNLEHGLMSITEAAYEAGYHHPSNFTSAFKKVFGVAPHEVVNSH
ncbi:AraC family transcriptional regulator [Vibrio rotiferianus]|uniref:AraC family transcriptional regulator n=1 Tax=Vibrio rotiferianus TaxID=190895 RepID=UPI0005EFCE8A|nr:AraC family transcriptional regulator [Vibrio rotiferianus]